MFALEQRRGKLILNKKNENLTKKKIEYNIKKKT